MRTSAHIRTCTCTDTHTHTQPRRMGVDDWDRRMMERDKRITGSDLKQQVQTVRLQLYMHAHITCTYAVLHTYIHRYVHTYIRTYVRTYIHTYVHTCLRTCLPTYRPPSTTRALNQLPLPRFVARRITACSLVPRLPSFFGDFFLILPKKVGSLGTRLIIYLYIP